MMPPYPPGVTPHLRTRRLDLAPLVVDDAREMVLVLADPDLYAFTGGEPPTRRRSAAGTRASSPGRPTPRARRGTTGSCGSRTVARSSGRCRRRSARQAGEAEIAWVTGVPWQGRGYATEAAAALVEWLAETGTRSVVALIHPGHPASAAVARHLGLLPTDELVDGERVWRRPLGDGV